VLSFENRFDDPRDLEEGRYRTLYVAADRRTAIAETLQAFRRGVRVTELLATLGPPEEGDRPRVGASWRQDRALAAGELELLGEEPVDVADLTVRQEIERNHELLLAFYGIRHFDFSEMTSKQRALTQHIAVDYYQRGVSGIVYPSSVTGEPCLALFEGLARLEPMGGAESLCNDIPELVELADVWGIELEAC
jgi:hypothetical protein